MMKHMPNFLDVQFVAVKTLLREAIIVLIVDSG